MIVSVARKGEKRRVKLDPEARRLQQEKRKTDKRVYSRKYYAKQREEKR